MSKKIFILSIFALLTVLLCGCGNNSKKKNLADVDSNDPIVTQWAQDLWAVDNFSDEAL